MIPNQWYAILDAAEVKPGQAVGVTRMGQKLVVWRDRQGKLGCLDDRCPHRGAALSCGPVQGDRVACPFHGFEFDASGRCRLIPANGSATPVPKIFQAESYPVREAHGFIWLWWHRQAGQAPAELPPISFFPDLDSRFTASAALAQHWPVHYSRAIENQLDVAHLPFVHATTIGRGGRMVVDGPRTRLENDVLDLWVYNRADDGTSPRKASELPPPSGPFYIQFRFPNVWQNHISDHFSIVVAFAPVDEGNTVLYMRIFQRVVRLPLLGSLASAAMLYSSIPILNQDRRVVITQRPVKSELRMGEKLIPADFPIIAYRRRRQELIDAAECAEIDGARAEMWTAHG